MKAMTSRCGPWRSLCCSVAAVGRLGAEEIDEHPDVAAPAADGSSSEISISETADEPAERPQEQEATEPDAPAR